LTSWRYEIPAYFHIDLGSFQGSYAFKSSISFLTDEMSGLLSTDSFEDSFKSSSVVHAVHVRLEGAHCFDVGIKGAAPPRLLLVLLLHDRGLLAKSVTRRAFNMLLEVSEKGVADYY
jgi:hypothetical protein